MNASTANSRIEFTTNTTDVRVVFRNNRAVSTIMKTDTGKYRVVSLYSQYVKDFDSYSEARAEALVCPSTRPQGLCKFGPRKPKDKSETNASGMAETA